MKIAFSLSLPRDGATVPVVRHVCSDALTRLGVEDECIGDIQVAVTEACANVLHATTGADDLYEVRVEIDETFCDITVIDQGTVGFEHKDQGLEHAPALAESGRGIYLMRALVDDLSFVSEDGTGTQVRLKKKLVLRPDSLIHALMEREAAAQSADS